MTLTDQKAHKLSAVTWWPKTPTLTNDRFYSAPAHRIRSGSCENVELDFFNHQKADVLRTTGLWKVLNICLLFSKCNRFELFIDYFLVGIVSWLIGGTGVDTLYLLVKYLTVIVLILLLHFTFYSCWIWWRDVRIWVIFTDAIIILVYFAWTFF